MSSETTDRVAAVIASEFMMDPALVVEAANLADDLDLDSLEIMQLTMALEDEFRIEVPNKEISHLLTVRDVVRFIEEAGGR